MLNVVKNVFSLTVESNLKNVVQKKDNFMVFHSNSLTYLNFGVVTPPRQGVEDVLQNVRLKCVRFKIKFVLFHHFCFQFQTEEKR